MADVAGWEMPLHYGSPVEEHQRVREYGGIFDVSHLSRVRVSGRHARRLLEHVLTRYVSDMDTHTCRHALVCNEAGGVIDDVLVFRFEEHWLLTGDAANRARLIEHLHAHTGAWTVNIADQTESTAMVAIQGPGMMTFISKFSSEVPTLDRLAFTVKNLLVLKMTVSRTGITGEDGIELMLPTGMVGMALKLLFRDTGDGAAPVLPCGMIARDMLRVEAGLPACGAELTEQTDPLSAGLDEAVSLGKDENDSVDRPFIGQAALQGLAATVPSQRCVGLKVEGEASPVVGGAVSLGGDQIGRISSACLSPTLGSAIAMGFVDAAHAETGTTVSVIADGATVDAQIVKRPFYERG